MEPGPGACPSLFPEPWGFWNPWPWTRDPLDWHLVWGSLKGGWGPPATKLRDTFSAPLPACGESCGSLTLRGQPVWVAVNSGCHIACTRICPLLDPPWVHWQVCGLFPWWLLRCEACRPAPAPAMVLLSARCPDRGRLGDSGLQGSCWACSLPGPARPPALWGPDIL